PVELELHLLVFAIVPVVIEEDRQRGEIHAVDTRTESIVANVMLDLVNAAQQKVLGVIRVGPDLQRQRMGARHCTACQQNRRHQLLLQGPEHGIRSYNAAFLVNVVCPTPTRLRESNFRTRSQTPLYLNY